MTIEVPVNSIPLSIEEILEIQATITSMFCFYSVKHTCLTKDIYFSLVQSFMPLFMLGDYLKESFDLSKCKKKKVLSGL